MFEITSGCERLASLLPKTPVKEGMETCFPFRFDPWYPVLGGKDEMTLKFCVG